MGDTVTLYIDDQAVQAPAGERLLWVALDNGFFIPHLCAVREREHPFGACRLCFVEIQGRETPVLSCSEPVSEGMRVATRSDRVDRVRRRAFDLLMSHHDLACKRCGANGACGLQQLAKQLKAPLKPKSIKALPTEFPVDESHPKFVLNPNRCVLCGKCIWVCHEVEKAGVLDFTYRGLKTRVGTFREEPLADSSCTGCLKCVDICPVGALTRKGDGKPRTKKAAET